MLPVGRISDGDRLGGDEATFSEFCAADRPVHQTRKHDLTVDDYRIGVGDPDALVGPYRHPGHEVRAR